MNIHYKILCRRKSISLHHNSDGELYNTDLPRGAYVFHNVKFSKCFLDYELNEMKIHKIRMIFRLAHIENP